MTPEDCIKEIKKHIQMIPEPSDIKRENPAIKELDNGLNEVINIIQAYEIQEFKGDD